MSKSYHHIFCYMTIAAVIAGCASNNNRVINVPAEHQDVLVSFSLDLDVIPTGVPVAAVFDGHFEHTIKMDGYSVFVNNEERGTDVSLNDQFLMTVPVNAIVHVIHKDSVKDLNADVVDAISLTGHTQVKAGYKNVLISMKNYDFGFVTIEQSEHVYSSTLNDTTLYKHHAGYSYAYTARNEGLLIFDTTYGFSYHHLDVVHGSHYKCGNSPAKGELFGDMTCKEKDIRLNSRMAAGTSF